MNDRPAPAPDSSIHGESIEPPRAADVHSLHFYRRLVILSLVATYLLIFIGGLVRVSGAGLGCPDWPNCFGSWIPPTSVEQIPADIDPTSFNLTLAWIEYGNRLIGVLVGLIILDMALYAMLRLRHRPLLLWGSMLSALLVAFQGWQGSIVVASELRPLIVTTHLLLALLLASLLILLLADASRTTTTPLPKRDRAATLLFVLWLATLVQVVFGTQLRGALDHLADSVPLLSDLEWLSRSGSWYLLHAVFGFLLVFGTIVNGLMLRRMLPDAAQSPLSLLLLSVVAQLALGLSVFAFGLIPILQLFHLWLAAICIGIVLWLLAGVRYQLFTQRTEREALAGSTPLAAVGLLVALLAFGGWAVVRQAHASRIALPIIKEAPRFSFPDHAGGRYTTDSLIGHITVVDFIFTRCRGICPALRTEMQRLHERYAHSDKLRLLSFSVEPEHDSLPVLAAYAAGSGVTDRRWLFLRPDSIEQMSKLCEEGFLVSGDLPGGHSGQLLLFDTRGKLRGYYDHSVPSEMELLQTHINDLARLDN